MPDSFILQPQAVRDVPFSALGEVVSGIRKVAVEAFGKGYDDDIIQDLQRRKGCPLKIYEQDNELIAFGYGYSFNQGALSSYFCTKSLGKDAVSIINRAPKVGVIKSVAVKTDFQSQGLGTSIVRTLQNDMHDEGISDYVVPAWRAGERINIEKTLLNLGYHELVRDDNFWKDDCDAGAFVCPDRKRECICGAVYFHKSYKM